MVRRDKARAIPRRKAGVDEWASFANNGEARPRVTDNVDAGKFGCVNESLSPQFEATPVLQATTWIEGRNRAWRHNPVRVIAPPPQRWIAEVSLDVFRQIGNVSLSGLCLDELTLGAHSKRNHGRHAGHCFLSGSFAESKLSQLFAPWWSD